MKKDELLSHTILFYADLNVVLQCYYKCLFTFVSSYYSTVSLFLITKAQFVCCCLQCFDTAG